jgi:hypothetical protein
MGLRTYGASVLSAVAAALCLAGPQRDRPLWPQASSHGVGALEAIAATNARDPGAIRGLAQAYLDARQPGLAVVLIERSPAEARDDVRVRHTYARALLDEGRSEEALTAERSVLAACGPLSEGRPAPDGCDPVIFASAVRRVGILKELVARGVEDAQAHPEETLVAYQNATREARVMVQ